MRVLLLLAALSLGGAVLAAPSSRSGTAPLPHQITCNSPRALKAYEQGMSSYHLGMTSEAIASFEEAARRDPQCAMAHWGLSRALAKAGKTSEAVAAGAEAKKLASYADDREQRLIGAWNQSLNAPAQPEGERKKALDGARREMDLAIAVYPDDPELWIQRGDLTENPVRAAPYFIAALRLQSGHPFGSVWSPRPPAMPPVTPTPTKAVEPLAEAPKLFSGLGVLSHPVTTRSPEAQAYYEQGLRTLHAYVVPGTVKNSAAACFQHAANLDPECAMAYWGLSFCNTSAMKSVDAANRALELALKHGTEKERRFCTARVLELSQGKREEFFDALSAAIGAYPEDVELWLWRGKVYGSYGGGSSNPASIPYHIAAWQMRPEHPSPNHELIHLYEAIDRPALGWPYTEGFRRSAPNMPHAHHMQAHLAMRLGRWQEAIDCTRTSRRKSLEGYPELDPSHHIDILVRALAHEGRFKEADAEPKAYRDGLPWARLLQLRAEPEALEAWAERRRQSNAVEGFYISALAMLDRGDPQAALPFIAKVEEQWRKNSTNSTNLYRYNEVKGRYLVQTGSPEDGLRMLREAGAKAVKDAGLHAWGGGSYLLEVWGEAALRAHRWDEAEEAYHEALAHEHGSILGALGMQVVWEQRGRPERARHYAARAEEIWKGADAGALDRQRERVRRLASGSAVARAE